MGSGTTAVAAKLLDRNFIGCELHQEYKQIFKKRLNELPTTFKDTQSILNYTIS